MLTESGHDTESILRTIGERYATHATLEALRLELARLQPIQTLAIFFARQHTRLRPPILDQVLQSREHSRHRLLWWVYRDQRVLRNLAFLRFPSDSKRRLVEKLLERCARRGDHWQTSKIIHAYAFRPDAFEEPPEDLDGREWWGPLYRRVELSRRRRSPRVLHVPNGPLRRVQLALLRVVLDRAAAELPDYVFGCGGHPSSNVFENARRHLNQRFVATFDLKRFFDSVTVGHVIGGLRRLSAPMLEEVTTSAPDSASPELRVIRRRWDWEQDACVLVARLCTLKGRLPQGAATSPVLANLAFRPYDERIKLALGDSYVFTRYFDDIAVSISEAQARREQIDDEQTFLARVQTILEQALAGSPFKLNEPKTRVGSTLPTRTHPDQSHRITGLNVSGHAVKLRRGVQRRIRAFVHSLEKFGLLSTARRKIGSEVQGEIEVRALPGRPDLVAHFRQGRKTSSERLAALMLRSTCSGLRVQLTTRTRLTDPADGSSLFQGDAAWPVVERLLGYLWREELRAQSSGARAITVTQDGSEVCQVTADASVDYLSLSRRDAVACAELWHRLRGLVACLNVPQTDSCFDDVRHFCGLLEEALRRATLLGPDGVHLARSARGRRPNPSGRASRPATFGPIAVALTLEQQDESYFRLIFSYIQDYWKAATQRASLPPTWVAEAAAFQRLVATRDELGRWLSAAAALCVDLMPRRPTASEVRSQVGEVSDVIRIMRDLHVGDRVGNYLRVTQFFRRHGIPENAPTCPRRTQRAVLDELNGLLGAVSAERRQMNDLTRWCAAQPVNPWAEPMSQRLERAADDFRAAHEAVRSSATERRLIQTHAAEPLAEGMPELRRALARNGITAQFWRDLYSVATLLNKVTLEPLEGPMRDGERVDEHEQRLERELLGRLESIHRSFVQDVHALRNRGAHGETEPRREQIRRVQNTWLMKLGRREDRSEGASQDLEITASESNEIKLQLLEGMIQLLRAASRNEGATSDG